MLSALEEELINAVARGHSNAQIASSLGLDEAAVQEGIAGVLKRLGLCHRVELIFFACSRDSEAKKD